MWLCFIIQYYIFSQACYLEPTRVSVNARRGHCIFLSPNCDRSSLGFLISNILVILYHCDWHANRRHSVCLIALQTSLRSLQGGLSPLEAFLHEVSTNVTSKCEPGFKPIIHLFRPNSSSPMNLIGVYNILSMVTFSKRSHKRVLWCQVSVMVTPSSNDRSSSSCCRPRQKSIVDRAVSSDGANCRIFFPFLINSCFCENPRHFDDITNAIFSR